MIRIDVARDQAEQLQRIAIRGHADSGPFGEDLVCAAVSGISIGMTNAVERMCELQLTTKDESGDLELTMPSVADETVRERMQLLLEAMLLALADVADAYPDFVQITQQRGE
jgi:uncharacterized protein